MDYTRQLDSTRPITFACDAGSAHDMASQYCDVLSVNHYQSWYNDYGHTELIQTRLTDYLQKWNQVCINNVKILQMHKLLIYFYKKNDNMFFVGHF